MPGRKRLEGRAIVQLIVIAIVLWIAFRIGEVVIQIALGLLALAGLGLLLRRKRK